MGRLRVRNTEDSAWIDICESEWYVRDPSNLKWVRLIPGKLSARHGSDQYWININCFSEEQCGPDRHGGTEDGKGDNGSGVGPKPSLPDGPDNPNSGGEPSPGSGIITPTTPVPPPDNVNSPDDGSSSGDEPVSEYIPGEPYVPGYDLPDAGEEGAGPKENPDGTISINRPALGVGETYEDSPDTSTGEDGTFENPASCPATVFGGTRTITEFYVDVGSQTGIIYFDYAVLSGRVSFDVYYAGLKVASTSGKVTNSATLSFAFDAGLGGGETKIMIRARQDAGSDWMISTRCPTEEPEDNIGTPANPAPCHGTFEPSHGGGSGVHEFVHDMGSEAGEVVIDYQMWIQADKMQIIQRGVIIAETNGFVSGVGQLRFNYSPIGNNTTIVVRMISVDATTSFVYLINCPDAEGSSFNPMPCGVDSTVHSGGAGITDTYFNLGTQGGYARVRYQMYNIMDKLDVYQAGNLLATTGGPVAGENYLPFVYAPADGDIMVRVTGEGQTSWSFLVECATIPPALSILDGCVVEGNSGTRTMCFPITMNPAPTPREITVDYTAVDNTASSTVGNSNILATDSNGNPFIAILEGSGSVGNVVFDGGFPKFYNSVMNSATDYAGLTGSFKYLHNCISWIADTSKGTEVLIIGDANDADGDYWVGGIGSGDFGISIPAVVSIAGFTSTIMDRDSYPSGEIALSTLNQYAAIVMIGSRTTGTSLTEAGAAVFGTYVQGGGGLMLITDHTVFQSTVNRVASRFNAKFEASIDRSSIAVDTIITEHGAHPIWNNMEGETISAGASEGNIIITDKDSDFISTSGTLVIPAGAFAGQICVEVNGDTETEEDETFSVVLSNPNNAILADSVGIGTILTDDFPPTGEALIFDTTAEIEALILSGYTPPTPQDIFNTWPRVGDTYYFEDSSTATGDSAAWQFLTGPDRFNQPNNTSQNLAIVSPTKHSDFVFEATLTSTDSDDDLIGLVAAFNRVSNVNYYIVIARTTGWNGSSPGGWVGLFIEGGARTVIWNEAIGTNVGGWSGKQTRVRIERTGTTLDVRASPWGDLNNLTGRQIIDLNNYPELSVAGSYGYYTHSQSDSTYLDIVFEAAGAGQDTLFDMQTNNVWEYVGSSWEIVGNGFQNFLTTPGYYTNTMTNEGYMVKPNSVVKTADNGSSIPSCGGCSMYPALDAVAYSGSTPDGAQTLSYSSGGGSGSNGTWYAEIVFAAPATETYEVKLYADDASVMYIDCTEVMTSSGNSANTQSMTITAGNHHLQLKLMNTHGGPTAFNIHIKDPNGKVIVKSDTISGWKVTSLV